MKKTLAWKDMRLGWKLLMLSALVLLIIMPLALDISKIHLWAVAGFLALINSSALFRMQELDTQDFFLYFQPVSRARILASKLGWVALSTLFFGFICFLSWSIMDIQNYKTPHISGTAPFTPLGLLPVLFLPALAPLVMILYFRSSHITAAFVSYIATLVWGFVALLLCPFFRFALGYLGNGASSDTIARRMGWAEFGAMVGALVAWNFYLFCRTDITEKPLGRSARLGVEFVVVFAWLAYLIGGANLWDLWYLLFG